MKYNSRKLKYEISNFEPYNEIHNGQCFYRALFCVLNHFKVDVMNLLCNNVYYYKFIYELRSAESGVYDSYMGLREVNGTDYVQLLAISGINMKGERNVQNLPQRIITSIDVNCPVVMFIDCYFEPIRKDTYKKIHAEHAITVYGYDIEEKMFNIIEHDYANGFIYKKQKLSFSDVENCYRGYVDNGREQFNSYYEFDNNLIQDTIWDYRTTFMKNYLNYVDHILKGFETLDQFISEFYINKKKEIELEGEAFKYVDLSARKIMRNHKIRNYTVSTVFKDDETIFDLITQITNDWFQVMALFTKFKVSTSPNKKLSFDKCAENLNRILTNEKAIHHRIIEYCKRELGQE